MKKIDDNGKETFVVDFSDVPSIPMNFLIYDWPERLTYRRRIMSQFVELKWRAPANAAKENSILIDASEIIVIYRREYQTYFTLTLYFKKMHEITLFFDKKESLEETYSKVVKHIGYPESNDEPI